MVPDTDSAGEEEPDDIFQGLCVSKLKWHCRRRGLSRTGTKSILLDRLRDYERSLIEGESDDDSESIGEEDPGDQFEGLTVVQLKTHCRQRGLRLSGNKQVLLTRLREYEPDHTRRGEEEVDNDNR